MCRMRRTLYSSFSLWSISGDRALHFRALGFLFTTGSLVFENLPLKAHCSHVWDSNFQKFFSSTFTSYLYLPLCEYQFKLFSIFFSNSCEVRKCCHKCFPVIYRTQCSLTSLHWILPHSHFLATFLFHS